MPLEIGGEYIDGPAEKRLRLERLRAELYNERSSFINHWKDINDLVWPRRGRFFLDDVNRGERRNQKIVDNTGTEAAKTLRAGLLSGMTNPSRPWFELSLEDLGEDIMASQEVKRWLHQNTNAMRRVFIKSNLYQALNSVFVDMGTFGTGCMLVEEDFETVLRFIPIPIGSYMLANDSRGRVRVYAREYQMTVRQIVEQFGMVDGDPKNIDWTNISTTTKTLWINSRHREQWVQVVHIIQPNDNYDPNKLQAKYKRFSSDYYEVGHYGRGVQTSVTMAAGVDKDKLLRESGYDYFPVLAPRWSVTGNDVYGTDCPGMDALGDVRQLQRGEKRSLQAVDRMVDPPMRAPVSFRRIKAATIPGHITYADVQQGTQGFEPVFNLNFDVDKLERKQAQVRERINNSFYVELFKYFLASLRDKTATEAELAHDERFTLLGPMLVNFNSDLGTPLIDIAFDLMAKQGLISEAPEEIQGRDLGANFISVIAQAQKLAAAVPLERFTRYYQEMKSANPNLVDGVKEDQMVKNYAEITNISPDIMRTEDELAESRQARAEHQRQMEQQQAAMEQAETIKRLSQAKTGGEANALTDMAQELSG